MRRLVSTMKWDARLQWRNGFYYASLVVVVAWTLLLSQVPPQLLATIGGDSLAWLLPAAILGNLLVGTFYFIGGLLLLEKGEGTLEAQIVTPLRSSEYLLSKSGTLTVLAFIENSLMVVVVYSLRLRPWHSSGSEQLWQIRQGIFSFNILFYAAGLVFAAIILCLCGFLVVIRYDSINEYLLPSIAITSVLMLPLVTYLAGWQGWLLYLHPLQAALLLLEAAWQTIPVWQIIYALAYSLLWTWLLFRAARSAFYQFVIVRQGVAK